MEKSLLGGNTLGTILEGGEAFLRKKKKKKMEG